MLFHHALAEQPAQHGADQNRRHSRNETAVVDGRKQRIDVGGILAATATKHSPWYAIPADQKWYTRYLVSEIVLDALQKSCHEYPVLSDDAKAELLNCKAALEQE